MNALLIKHNENGSFSVEKLTIKKDNRLEEYYKYIGCDLVDIKRYYFKGSTYDVVMDDEGKLKDYDVEDINLLLLDDNKHVCDYVVGKLLIVKYDKNDDDLLNLTQKDIDTILSTEIALSASMDGKKIRALSATYM